MDDKTAFIEGFASMLPSEEFGHYLVYEPEPGREVNLEITEEPILIGRSDAVTLRLADNLVSGRHCRVFLEGALVTVEDLGSTNGTYVDRRRVSGQDPVPIGSVLIVGRMSLRHEMKSRTEVERHRRLALELERASNYVQSLLPSPISSGPVRTSWRFIPSAQLGGDAFGYQWLDDDTFAFYLLDVCGHGAGAALHSVAALNFLRRGNLPNLDLARPEAVLAELNRSFPMEDCGGMYFTLWYGVFDRPRRRLSYATAGHPPSFLRIPGVPDLAELHTPNLAVGMLSDTAFVAAEVELPPEARAYVLSDGVFEFYKHDGEPFSFDEFVAILSEPETTDRPEVDRIERRVRSRMSTPTFPDDFSLLTVSFP